MRVKKVKGLDYYYLVKNQWDPTRKTSVQHTIKYLGKTSDFTTNDIPIEYRNSPKVLSILASATKEREKKILIAKKIGKQVFENLKTGEVEKILKVAKKYKEQTSLAKFYDDVLKPVMYDVGKRWQNNELDIGTEHICSNTANKAINKLTELYKQANKANRIVICAPDGELHNIACNVLESIFLERGFNVLNISPSIPTDSVISYIRDSEPSLILVSVTLLDNIKSAGRLVKNIGNYFDIPILTGGLAINNICDNERKAMESKNPNVKLMINPTFEEIVNVVMDATKNSYNKMLRATNKG